MSARKLVPAAAAALVAALLSATAARADTACTVVAEAASGRVLVEEGSGCDTRVTPASTFKIPIALMGYDAGILVDAHNPALPFREGYSDWLPAWRQTTDPSRWMTFSVVWYSQQITRRLGAARFAAYVRAFGYGNEDVSGHPGKHDGLTEAWLSSSLAISPREQAAFLGRLVDGKLPVSAHAVEMTRRLTALDELPGAALPAGWTLNGKTGSGFPVLADGRVDRARPYGWFVGWATKAGRTVVFARLVHYDPRPKDPAGPAARDAFVKRLPEILGRL